MNVNSVNKMTNMDDETTMHKGDKMDRIQSTIEYLMNVGNTVQDVGKRYQEIGYEGAARRLFPGAFRIKLNLSIEEKHEVNKALCSRIKTGDSMSGQALILFNFPMLHQVVSQKCRGYGLTVEDYEDILLDCARHLVEKLTFTFDPDSAPFYFYAKESIQRQAGKLCKKLKIDTMSLDETFEDEEGNAVSRMDVTPDEKTSAENERVCMLHSIYTEVEKLPLQQRVVFSMHHGLGGFNEMSFAEIAEYIGMKPQKVYQYYKQAKNTIRENLDIRPAA